VLSVAQIVVLPEMETVGVAAVVIWMELLPVHVPEVAETE
jgi:hypothetical protein